MALTQNRVTRIASVPIGGALPQVFNPNLGIADSVHIFAGAMVSQDNSGYIRPARATSTDVIIGVADQEYDNTLTGHAAGFALFPNGFKIQIVTAYYDNDTGSPVLSSTQRGTALYVVDDHTVSLSSSGSSRPQAGKLWCLDPQTLQVIVVLGPAAGL